MRTLLLSAVLAGGWAWGQTPPKQQCATSVVAGRDVRRCTPYESWVLDYTCESGQQGRCRVPENSWKQFDSKQDAIDWIEQHYQFSPGSLQHRGGFLSCYVTWLYPDDKKEDRRMMKSVECMTEKEFNEKYCQEGCTWSAINLSDKEQP